MYGIKNTRPRLPGRPKEVKPKYKFDKTKCRKCAYHRVMQGFTICNYACVTGQTCLHKTKNGVEDSRGDDYNNCKLFVEGALIADDED